MSIEDQLLYYDELIRGKGQF